MLGQTLSWSPCSIRGWCHSQRTCLPRRLCATRGSGGPPRERAATLARGLCRSFVSRTVSPRSCVARPPAGSRLVTRPSRWPSKRRASSVGACFRPPCSCCRLRAASSLCCNVLNLSCSVVRGSFLGPDHEALLARCPPSRLCAGDCVVSFRLWLAPIRRLLSPGKAQLRPREQHALAALVAGTLHVSDTRVQWGAASHCSAYPMCESLPATLEHRMWACRAEGVPPAPQLPSWLAAALRSAGPEAVPLAAERPWGSHPSIAPAGLSCSLLSIVIVSSPSSAPKGRRSWPSRMTPRVDPSTPTGRP